MGVYKKRIAGLANFLLLESGVYGRYGELREVSPSSR